MKQKIAYQGEPGAYSHQACVQNYPDMEPFPCHSFEEAFSAVAEGYADKAMIPVENTLAGRVADIHYLLPESHLRIEAEKFLPIHHFLMGTPDSTLDTVKRAHSHVMALGQCRLTLHRLGIKAAHAQDTAGAAKMIAQKGHVEDAAVASKLAAEIYNLKVLAENIEDATHNATRFLVMSRDAVVPSYEEGTAYVTSFVFRVRNIPAALYKAMGGFATNSVNMTKLESYQLGGSFTATRFYADVAAHPDEHALHLALEELAFFSTEIKMLGTYVADPFRLKAVVNTPS
ncbi:MAG: prephenate dehydratase [Robiginitomaculum sp.]|nr:prephenate dehydratase [Robiginitomaculum sp.]MDQ7076520.1 prephenate dehydratase [Robiginitomaculum sp.]